MLRTTVDKSTWPQSGDKSPHSMWHKSHWLTEHGIRIIHSYISQQSRGNRRAFAKVINPNASIDYVFHAVCLSSSCMAS